ncbi:MAG: hypothetical protein IH818_14200 [Acidobacteria bacterium]|nr:hypothetical protein [Acidobacteriota bacterium]
MRRLRISFALAAVMALTLALPASAGAREKAPVNEFGTTIATGGFISIDRNADDVDVNIYLRDLNPGNAYTVWAVVWNIPSECASDDGCVEDDLFVANNAIFFSGVGGVANGGGVLNGNTVLVEGATQTGPFVNVGLTNAEGAEIHFVVQDHGPASDDAGTLMAQTGTFHGGCDSPAVDPEDRIWPTVCNDPQATAFKP